LSPSIACADWRVPPVSGWIKLSRQLLLLLCFHAKMSMWRRAASFIGGKAANLGWNYLRRRMFNRGGGGGGYGRRPTRYMKRYSQGVPRQISLGAMRKLKFPPETKYWDEWITSGGAIGQNPANWSKYHLTSMIQGTDTGQRIGLNCNVLSASFVCDIKAVFNAPTVTQELVRIMMVRTYKPMQFALASGNLMQDDIRFNSTIASMYLGCYQILYDRVITLAVGVNEVEHVKILRRCGWTTKYADASAAEINVAENSLCVVMWSDQTGATRPTINEGYSRICYTDA